MGLAAADRKESRPDWDVWNGYYVWSLRQLSLYQSWNLTNPHSICILTLIRVWVTTLIKGQSNEQKIFSMLALLTCLEALLGIINACLPVMKPVFTLFGDSKFFTWATSSFTSSGYRSQAQSQRSANGKFRSTTQTPNKKGSIWSRTGQSSTGEEDQEMGSWIQQTRSESSMPPAYVNKKAAELMFSHTNANTRSAAPFDIVGAPPVPPPPKSQHPVSESAHDVHWQEKGNRSSGIMVQRDWDVERGYSGETERGLLPSALKTEKRSR